MALTERDRGIVRMTAKVSEETRNRCSIMATMRKETMGDYLTKIIDVKWVEYQDKKRRLNDAKSDSL